MSKTHLGASWEISVIIASAVTEYTLDKPSAAFGFCVGQELASTHFTSEPAKAFHHLSEKMCSSFGASNVTKLVMVES